MFKCTVRYGIDVEPFQSSSPITVGQIRRDGSLRARLGYGDNINVMVSGVTLPEEAIIANDSEVVIETACNKKAGN